MMPDIDPREERRKKRAPVIAFIVSGGLLGSVLLQWFEPGWQWVSTAIGAVTVIAVTAVGLSIDLPSGRGRGSRRTSSGLSRRGPGGDERAVGAGAHRWRVLVMVSRLMPRAAGRRWLAEAESVLSEIAAVQRGAAIRSYLLSAPGLVVMMWAREAQRRARPGARRPG